MAFDKATRRKRIQRIIRTKVSGTSERPRLSVFRSNTGIYAQIIDDSAGRTLAAASSKKVTAEGGNGVALAAALAAKSPLKRRRPVSRKWYSTARATSITVVLNH